MAESRRQRFDVHAEEEARLLRCLLCQQWIEADHEEALALHRDRSAWDEATSEILDSRFDVLR